MAQLVPEAHTPLLTVAEVAAYLQLPVATLYAWRHRGEGPLGFRVGRYVRYRRADVDRWIAAQAAMNSTGPSAA